jgi:hypothetical protein
MYPYDVAFRRGTRNSYQVRNESSDMLDGEETTADIGSK